MSTEPKTEAEAMAEAEASREAVRRWGYGTWVGTVLEDDVPTVFEVGKGTWDDEVILGSGSSWAEAFADADRKTAVVSE